MRRLMIRRAKPNNSINTFVQNHQNCFRVSLKRAWKAPFASCIFESIINSKFFRLLSGQDSRVCPLWLQRVLWMKNLSHRYHYQKLIFSVAYKAVPFLQPQIACCLFGQPRRLFIWANTSGVIFCIRPSLEHGCRGSTASSLKTEWQQ